MEASIREPNIKHFTRLIQCAAKYGDDLCMHATSHSWELIVTNSTKSAYVCFTLEPSFFSKYKAVGDPTEQRRGVKCQLYAKSVLSVLGKASSVKAVERVDLKIYDPEGGLRSRTQHSDDEEESDDDIHVATRTAHLELKLVYHHGITKKHFLHLHPSEGLRVIVDTDSQPSGFLVSARVLRDWLDHFTIAFGSSTGSNGAVRGDSHLAWQFSPRCVKIKNYETATTSVLATEITIDTRDFSQYLLEEECVELSLPMREFKGTLQLADSLGMDLDFWFSEASQPMVMTSTFLGPDGYGNETNLFKIFCALATTSTDAFTGAPPSSNGAPRDRAPLDNFSQRRSESRSIKSETRSMSISSQRDKPPLEPVPRRTSARPRASLTMSTEQERPPTMVTVVGGPITSRAPSQSAGPNDPEPLFQPGPSQMSVQMSQQEVLDMAGMGDLDLEAMLEDAEAEDKMDATEELGHDAPSGWEDIEADFGNISEQRMSTQREHIAAAQRRPSGSASSISQREFSMSRHGSSSDSIRPVESGAGASSTMRESIIKSGSRESSRRESGTGRVLSREPSRMESGTGRALKREPSRNANDSGRGLSREPSRGQSDIRQAFAREPSSKESGTGPALSREPSRGASNTSRQRSREPSAREANSSGASTNLRRNSTSEFKPDLDMFGDTGAEETLIGDDEELELGPTQATQGRVFETLFDD